MPLRCVHVHAGSCLFALRKQRRAHWYMQAGRRSCCGQAWQAGHCSGMFLLMRVGRQYCILRYVVILCAGCVHMHKYIVLSGILVMAVRACCLGCLLQQQFSSVLLPNAPLGKIFSSTTASTETPKGAFAVIAPLTVYIKVKIHRKG